MAQLSMEYHAAKKNYSAVRSHLRRADGKENNKGDSLPTKTEHKTVRTPLATKDATQRLHLPSDYNTAKLQYKASKLRAKSASAGKNRESASEARTTHDLPRRDSATPTNGNLHGDAATDPESGVELLGLIRPLDHATYEFGLAAGIEAHLVESVKLCGLRKGRETSILDMVRGLCRHLTRREEDVARWIEFADHVALAATEKYRAACGAREEAREALEGAQRALLSIQQEVSLLKVEWGETKDGVSETVSTFPAVIRDVEDRLRRQFKHHCDSARSECKSEVCEAVEELSRLHDLEKQQFEAAIGSLDNALQDERERVTSLQSQLGKEKTEFEKDRSDSSRLQTELRAEAAKAHEQLAEAAAKIRSLEESLDQERQQKERELEAVDAKMRAELDDIDAKVKQSFAHLTDRKDREIAAARSRARAAEAAATAAEQLLSELKARVLRPAAAAAAATTAEVSRER